MYTLIDLVWATFWERFPDLKFSLTEGDIGWIPYFLWRSEHVNDRHHVWIGHDFSKTDGFIVCSAGPDKTWWNRDDEPPNDLHVLLRHRLPSIPF